MFPLITLGILLAYVYWVPVNRRPNKIGGAIGALLIIIGVSQTFIEPARIIWWEWLAFIAGLLILGVTLGVFALENQTESAKTSLSKIGWSWLLAFPYFITFFYAYSYHYRLAFSIVPLMILPTAVILSDWVSPDRLQNWRPMLRRGYLIALIAVSLPGVMIFAYDESEGWDWLWTRSDNYAAAGSSLQGVVATIQTYIDTHEEPPVIIAPGLQPLPFYFPLVEIRVTDTPRTIAEMEGATHFIHSREGLLTYERQYEDASAYQHQWFASLRRNNVVDLVARYSDPSFFYEVYQFLGDEIRFEPLDYDIPVTETVDFGGFVRFTGYSPMETQLDVQDLNLELVWEVLDKPLEDYTLYLHIFREDSPDDVLVGADGPVLPTNLGYYSTLFWDIGEYIKDTRLISQADLLALPPGEYRIRIGWYNWQTLARVPVTINGDQVSDGYTLDTIFIRGE
jgi:hypothetical protein